MRFDDNIMLLSDSYKATHWKQYPPKTSCVYSYFESRGGQYDHTVFFGLQYYLKKYLQGIQVTEDKILDAKHVWDTHLGPGLFNEAGWRHILEKHAGRLPVSIKAVPEGTVVPTHNVLMTIENTDPECYWLTNFLETLLVQVWYGCTVATQSRAIKQEILQMLEKTGDPSLIQFKLHDFGFRGVSSVESAAVGGAAHLINFSGTDTMAGILLAREYYYESGMPGFSIPASEHSTITSWGKEHEVDAFRNMLDQYPTGLVACVSDSYDIIRACREHWGKTLKDQILERNGTLVVRPDSGDPTLTVMQVLNDLGNAFGVTLNSKGFKLLPPQVRIIQGDGVDHHSIRSILTNMHTSGWSADNIAFGMGGALLQKLHRDTQKFAFKCSAAEIDGEWRDVFKQPIGDQTKKSKGGRLQLIKGINGFETVRQSQDAPANQLLEVFRDGQVLREYSFAEIRDRASVK